VGIAALWAAWGRWVRHEVRVVPNQELPVQVEEERRGEVLLLRGSVENRGDDVPELSLRSVGVVVEGVYRDGRRVRARAFPRAPYRAEGALLHGETGRFEMALPRRDLREVVVRSEVVDLGEAKRFVRPYEGRRR